MRATTVRGANAALLLLRCALRKFHVTDDQTCMIRVRVIKGPKAHDQTTLCAFHSFLVEVQTNAGYIRATHRNGNLEIRIAGSSCCPQLLVYLILGYNNVMSDNPGLTEQPIVLQHFGNRQINFSDVIFLSLNQVPGMLFLICEQCCLEHTFDHFLVITLSAVKKFNLCFLVLATPLHYILFHLSIILLQ